MDKVKEFFLAMWAAVKSNLILVVQTYKFTCLFILGVGFLLGAWVL